MKSKKLKNFQSMGDLIEPNREYRLANIVRRFWPEARTQNPFFRFRSARVDFVPLITIGRVIRTLLLITFGGLKWAADCTQAIAIAVQQAFATTTTSHCIRFTAATTSLFFCRYCRTTANRRTCATALAWQHRERKQRYCQ